MRNAFTPMKLPRHLVLTAMAGLLCAFHGSVGAQASTTESELRSQAEARRQQQHEQEQRQRLQTGADVRLPAPAAAPLRLPEQETPCFPIRQLELRGDVPDTPFGSRFGWVLDALAGPNQDDGPLRKCLGAQGVSVLLHRAQDALVAKGFVTTRIFAQPQDLSSGSLVLTVVPGRIRAIRFTEGAPTSLHTALAAQPGEVLNLRDIEQALENFKRVPTADADIQIAPADQPDQSDLLISYTPSAESATPLNAPRDRLTNMPLDAQGRYSRTVVLDGKMYEPKLHSCASAECSNNSANLDRSDPATQAYIKALDQQVFKDIGKGATAGTLVTPVGPAATVLMALGLAASGGQAATSDKPIETGFDEAMKAASEKGGAVFFEEVLGHTPGAAARASALINLAGGWDAFVNRVKIDVFGMKPNDTKK